MRPRAEGRSHVPAHPAATAARLLLAGLLAGAVTGWGTALHAVVANRYLPQGLWHLAARTLDRRVSSAGLTGLALTAAGLAAVLVLWPVCRWLLADRWRGLRGAVIAVPVVAVGARAGLFINREFLPGILELTSLAASAALAAAAAGTWWALVRATDVLARLRFPPLPRLVTGRGPGVLAIALLVVAHLLPLAVPAPAAGDRPDIIILLVDTLRVDRLGAYGYARDTSPHIDALARDGWLFTQAASTASWTKPAIASLFTSRYPRQAGIDSASWNHAGAAGEVRVDVLDPRLTTLSEVLASGGYSTVAVGHNHHLTERLGFAQGFDRYIWGLKNDVTFTSAPEIHRRFLAWVDRHRGPFFGYLHYIDVHWPYLPPPPFAGHFAGPPPEIDYNTAGFMDAAQAAGRRGDLHLAPDLVAHMSDAYDEEIQFVDEQIGRLLEELRARDLYDSSLIVFTADHGEEFLEHGHLAHGTGLYDVLVHVPLIIKFPCPGPSCGSRTIDAQVSLLDLLPTLASAAGLTPPAGIEGADLAGPISPARLAISEWGEQVSLRTPSSKFIYSLAGGTRWMYDLVHDPGESVDLSRRQPEATAALRDQVLAWVARTSGSESANRPGVAVDEQTLRQLRALGYVE
ncbi:MAG: sulfatase [Acidobacteriota bacterium]